MLWAAAALAGMFAWSDLDGRLNGAGEAPESESHTVSEIARRDFGEAAAGSFLVLYEAPATHWRSPAFVKVVRASVRRAAQAAAGRSSPLLNISPRVAYAALPTELSAAAATKRAAAIEQAAGRVPGARVEITGFPIVSAELSSIITHDLRRAEVVAIPITAVILLLLFGSIPAVAVPLLFALTTISVAMGIVWVEAAFVEIPVYATSVVTLVGIALAVDYSMLYVSRYREEVRGGAPDRARLLRATTRTAGRALAISGLVVAAGLLPMALIPIPFFSGLGLATVAIPLASVLAAATLLPALLELLGPHLERLPVRVPRRLRLGSSGRPLSERLARVVIGRPLLSALTAGTVMVLVALPALGLGITGGTGEFLRLAHVPSGVGEGAVLAPSEVLIDSGRGGGVWAASTLAAERQLVARLVADPAVTTVQAPSELARARLPGAKVRLRAEQLGLVNGDGRFARIRIAGSEESGSRQADALIERLRQVYVPAANFGGGMAVRVGGVAARDYDFVHATTASVPPFGLVLVIVMFCLLAAMLRSVVLPLKAIAMSALSVAAACGVLVLVFQLGWGTVLGLGASDRIAVWVPVLLFAAMFGISTDYEIFMVTRMREEWLHSGDNSRAVLVGLRRISGVVTASALVMIVIFAGFTTSRVAALQQFGVGLVAGVFLDATVIRLVLVPSLMVLLGRWNWTFAAPALSSLPAATRTRMQQKTNHLSAPWVLTAPSAEELRARARALLERLDGTPAPELAMIFSALATEAAPQAHRAVLLGGSRDDLRRGLDDLAAGRRGDDLVSGEVRAPARVAFVFPPLRAEFEGMATDLLAASPAFHAQMRACETALEPFAEWCLDDVLHGRPGAPSLYRLDVSQHALFATCVSLARLWEGFGVRPEAVLGHSLGEVFAATISGSLTLEEAARVTNTWGRSAMRFENQGEMGLIALPAAELEERVAPWHGRIWISALNGPGWTSVSGEKEAVEELLSALAADGVTGRPMGISAPGHSPAVTVIHQWFAEELPSISPRPGTIPFYSGVVGHEVDQTGLNALYWSSSLGQRVYFEPALRSLLSDGYNVLLEVGPRRVLAEVLAETSADADADAIVVGTLDQADPGYLLRALAELFVSGVNVDWEAICGEEPLIPAEFWPAQRGATGDGVALVTLLADVPEIEREAVVLGLVRAEVARVVGLASAAEIDPRRPFKDLGFDSPKAVDLRNRLIEATGLDLSTTVAFDYPTPLDVACKLLLVLDGEEEAATEPTGPSPDEEAVEAIDELDLASLVELSRRQRAKLEEVSGGRPS